MHCKQIFYAISIFETDVYGITSFFIFMLLCSNVCFKNSVYGITSFFIFMLPCSNVCFKNSAVVYYYCTLSHFFWNRETEVKLHNMLHLWTRYLQIISTTLVWGEKTFRNVTSQKISNRTHTKYVNTQDIIDKEMWIVLIWSQHK